jgi:hypothetical protein
VKRLFTIATIISFSASAQVFIPENGKLKLYKDKKGTELLSEESYDMCFCDSVTVTDDSSGITTLAYMKPKKEDKGRLLVRKNNLWGILNADGEVKAAFTESKPFTYNASNNKIIFDNFHYAGFTFHGNRKSSLNVLGDSGEIIKQYYVGDDYAGHFLASSDNEHWGIVNANTRIIFKLDYDPARAKFTNFRFNDDGLVILETKTNDNKYGIVKYTGEVTAAFRYDYIVDYIRNKDTIHAQINGKGGYINYRGHVLYPLKLEKCPEELTDSNYVATDKEIWFMDRNFQQIRDLRFQALEQKGELYFYKKRGLWGIMDKNLNVIVKNQYYSIVDAPRIKGMNDFKALVVVRNQKYGVILPDGTEIIACKYNCRCTLGYFAPEGYFIELSDGGVAYRFNEKGEVVSKGSDSGKVCLCESYGED